MSELKEIARKSLERKLRYMRDEAKQRNRGTLAQHLEECMWLLKKATENDKPTED